MNKFASVPASLLNSIVSSISFLTSSFGVFISKLEDLFSILIILQAPNSSAGLPTEMQLGLLSPFYLRRLFERMGATYIKLGQV